MTRTSWWVIGLSLMMGAGCQSLSSYEFSALWEEHAPVGKPDEVAALWLGGVDVKPDPLQGGAPVPGFAGRIILMRSKPGDTVAVDGTIQVQCFLDHPGQSQAQPLEQWTILPEHLPMLLKKDISGWGYSVWLPWNSYSPNIRAVRLIVQYQPKEGGLPLYSTPMRVTVQDSKSKTSLTPSRLQVEQIIGPAGRRVQ